MAAFVSNIGDIDLVAGVRRRYGLDVLDALLVDRATKRNIIWADREYVNLGEGYEPYDEITPAKISDRRTIEPRVVKSLDAQAWRTKEKAEVFTPSWLCKQMVDCIDDAFFGAEPSGFTEGAATGLTDERMASLAEGGAWKRYVDNRLLEITCGEAPFICSPYDATTGDFVPTGERIGFLDRKLRVVGRYCGDDRDAWFKWARRALEASYGFEYQGDNLLIARINVLNTVSAFKEDAWGEPLDTSEARLFARIISWNLWQMDGLRGCVPSEWDMPQKEDKQTSMFDLEGFWDEAEGAGEQEQPMRLAESCKTYDWRARAPRTWESLKGQVPGMKKFFGVIGNPPYQSQSVGTQKNYGAPIYDSFLDGSFEVAEKVELVHPARFLFNAGGTPKAWNRKMLDDEHFKILRSSSVRSSIVPSRSMPSQTRKTLRCERMSSSTRRRSSSCSRTWASRGPSSSRALATIS